MGALIFLAVFWGIPMYLVDKRARRNRRSPRKRLLIAVLMIWWGMLFPVVIALALAGPGQPGWWSEWWSAWRASKPGARPYHGDDYDPWPQEHRRREEEDRQAAWAEEDARSYHQDSYAEDTW